MKMNEERATLDVIPTIFYEDMTNTLQEYC
jgi:hypothetical protein